MAKTTISKRKQQDKRVEDMNRLISNNLVLNNNSVINTPAGSSVPSRSSLSRPADAVGDYLTGSNMLEEVNVTPQSQPQAQAQGIIYDGNNPWQGAEVGPRLSPTELAALNTPDESGVTPAERQRTQAPVDKNNFASTYDFSGMVPNQQNAFDTVSNRAEAEMKFGRANNPSGTLPSGAGYNHYTPLGEDYEDYKTNFGTEFDITDPTKRQNLLDIFNPASPRNQTPERQAWLKEITANNPGILNNPEELARLATDNKPGPVHSLIKTSRDRGTIDKLDPLDVSVDIPQNFDLTEGKPGTPGIDIDQPGTGIDTRPEWMRYAPLAQGALALAKPPELEKLTASTVSTGLLDPKLVDEQTMRAGIDASVRGNVGALSNVTGGSGSAQRAALLAAGVSGAGVTSDAFLASNTANNQARMAADQYNIGTQTAVAGQNASAINAAESYNVGAQNAQDQEMFDTRLSMVQDTLDSAGKIGQENRWANINDRRAILAGENTLDQGFVQNPILPTSKDTFFGRTSGKQNRSAGGGTISVKLDKSGIKSSLL